MYWQTPIWPQFHVEQFAMHLAGITNDQFESLPMAIAAMLGYHRAVRRRHDLAPDAEGLIRHRGLAPFFYLRRRSRATSGRRGIFAAAHTKGSER